MRRALRAALAGVAAAGLVLAVAAPASAHNWIVSSTPAEGDVLTTLPAEWELVTNESMLYVGNTEVFGLWARDADGLFYGDGCVDVSGARMSATPVIGAPGDYTLVYALVSADGHPLTGEIAFEWAGEADVAPGTTDTGTTDTGTTGTGTTGTGTTDTGTTEATRCGAIVDEPADPGTPGEEPAPGIPADVWWIVGAVAAVVVGVVAALALGRRRPRDAD